MLNEKNAEDTKYWLLKKETLFEIFDSKIEGLDDSQIDAKREKYGNNIIRDKKRSGLLKLFFIQFLSPLIFILIFASSITFYLNEIIETIVILAAILINVFFSTWQEFKAESTIEKLNSFIKNTVSIIRNGIAKEIDAVELVPGDIIIVNYGSRIPADCRILESSELKIDESIITGESIPVDKAGGIVEGNDLINRHNYLYAGTFTTNGHGKAIVTSIGENTEIGKIALSISGTKKTQTPTQNAVQQMSWYIFLITLVIVVLIFVLGVSRGEEMFDMLVLASAIAVGAVPEALPIALTVILSVGVLNISKKGGLIRKLSSTETLGSTTLILTDKTGTLTRAELSLTNIYTINELLEDGLSSVSVYSQKHEKLLKFAFSNIEAEVEKVTKNKKDWLYKGSAFDTIILKTIYDHEIDIDKVLKNKLLLPFNSTNKYSISVSSDHKKIVMGAPDILVENSNLKADEKTKLLEIFEKLSNQGKRLIAVSYKKSDKTKNDEDISRLKVIGLFAFSDPLRENMHEYISGIQRKGVKVKIISGDLAGTVKFIAEKVSIKVSDSEILTGEEIKTMDDSQLLKTLNHVKIFARVTPEDKLRIGNLYRKLGEVVAMTGDGVNDAPALNSMDMGISLASATDVAKGAADMILIDNSFKTIANTIVEGHKIKANIQKVFIYLMSSSLGAVFVVTGSLLFAISLPLTALQIIWVNILTGTLPALAFAYDKTFVVNTRQIKDKIFNSKVKFLAFGIGIVSSIFLFILYFVLIKTVDQQLAHSVFFVCFATYALSVAYSFKNLDKLIFQYNPFSNMRLNMSIWIGFLMIFLTMTNELMKDIFQVGSIPLSYLWVIVLWNIFNVILIEITKYGFIRFAKLSGRKG
jgi:Ca2+-transporting ATPase